jgi:hypothetical protein
MAAAKADYNFAATSEWYVDEHHPANMLRS